MKALKKICESCEVLYLMNEEVLDAKDKEAYVKSKKYKRFYDISLRLRNLVEEPADYKEEFNKDPQGCIQDEVDTFYYIFNILKSIKPGKGYPEEVGTQLKTLLKSAENGYNRYDSSVKSRLKPGMTIEEYAEAKGPAPLTYVKRSVILLSEFFDIMNIEWDFPGWYTNPAKAHKMLEEPYEEYESHRGEADDSEAIEKLRADTKKKRKRTTSEERFLATRLAKVILNTRYSTVVFEMADIAKETLVNESSAKIVASAIRKRKRSEVNANKDESKI